MEASEVEQWKDVAALEVGRFAPRELSGAGHSRTATSF